MNGIQPQPKTMLMWWRGALSEVKGKQLTASDGNDFEGGCDHSLDGFVGTR